MKEDKKKRKNRQEVKKDYPSTVNINERIFAGLETENLTGPDWPESPLGRAENGTDRDPAGFGGGQW